MKIFISTCDSHINLLRPFSFLFNKFWSSEQEVIVLGYDEPKFKLPNNFKFESMGKDEGPKKWSNGLIRYFYALDDDFFIHGLEDFFLVKRVNLKILRNIIRFGGFEKIGRIGLSPGISSRKHKTCCNCDGYEIIESDQKAEYRITTQFNIWNKSYLQKYLMSDMSPWDFEIKGSQKAKNDGWHILATKEKFVTEYSVGVRGGNSRRLNFGKLNSSVKLEMKNAGLF